MTIQPSEDALQKVWSDAIGFDGGLQTVNADDLLRLSRAILAAGAPAGWKLVPIKPDDAMQLAGAQAIRFDTTVLNKIWTGNAVFAAMTATAPALEPSTKA